MTDSLRDCCRRVLEHGGVPDRELRSTPGTTHRAASVEGLEAQLRLLCEINGLRCRRVELRSGWSSNDCGALLGFHGTSDESLRPRALLPRAAGGYVAVEGSTGRVSEVSPSDDCSAFQGAFQLYLGHPEGRLSGADLLRPLYSGRRRELGFLLLIALAGGLVSLLVPLAVREVYGRILPAGDRSQLMVLGLVLVASALGAAAFQMTRSLAALRLVTRVDAVLVPIVWDRLLRLPARFFRRFQVGDLATRALAMDWIRETLSADVSGCILALVTATASLGLMLALSWKLTLVALASQAILVVSTVLFVRAQVRHRRRLLAVESTLSSLVFNLIQGIGKLRVGGAERAAYGRWAELFARQRHWIWKSQSTAQTQAVFVGVFELLSQLVLFAVMGYFLIQSIDLATFLAFATAYGQLQVALLGAVSMLPELLTIGPLYERILPLLEADLESPQRPRAGALRGHVELRGVSFQYAESGGPLVIDDVSIVARPGQCIAIVGPSGSGKTTLLRLLLGFERPLTGSVLYDGKSLSSLDMQSVRSQIGVVLQNSRPMAGDVYSNIVGSSSLGAEAAWEAARMAGLEDDIRAMPMGLHTLVGEGAATFSGGQRQRLMIARALVHKPRIVFFDEATSALDNPTQEIVRRSLEKLQATRILVAHRLSTIRHADMIYVLDRGRIVETGCYQELLDLGGAFSLLAERQLTVSREDSHQAVS